VKKLMKFCYVVKVWSILKIKTLKTLEIKDNAHFIV
jgi:hypothetical protein